MDDSRKTYELTFGGLPFKLRSSHDEETVRELSDFVEKKLQQALAATKSGSYQSAAILTALNIAEELILLKRRALLELDRIEQKAAKISQDIENSKSPRKEINV
jgi:cell division protein ZapA